jgi:hypothetical protein
LTDLSKPDRNMRRQPTLIAAGLLLAALALVVIYTNRGEFMSPLALVVVAAIGLAALLLQLRLRPGLSSSVRGPIWLNAIGVVFALAAVFADHVDRCPDSCCLLRRERYYRFECTAKK